MQIRPIEPADREAVHRLLVDETAGPMIVSRERLIDASTLDGLVARDDTDTVAGVVLLAPSGPTCEVVFLAAVTSGSGVGTALLAAARHWAWSGGARQLWLVTTSENTGAIRFYQKAGWELLALERDAVTRGRRLKPGIPLVGDGIPIRHELVFADWLDPVLFHVMPAADWAAASAAGVLAPASLDTEGFTHTSLAADIAMVTNAFYASVGPLVLVALDRSAVGVPVLFERADHHWFPHLYGPVAIAGAVLAAEPWAPGPDGTFTLPPWAHALADTHPLP